MSDELSITLPSTLNQEKCDMVKNEILSAIHKKTKKIVLDASSLNRMGTVGAQFLMSIGLMCKKSKINLRILNPHEEALAVLKDLECYEAIKNWGMVE